MLRQSNQKVRELHKVKINSGLTSRLKFFRKLPLLLFASFRFFSAAALVLQVFFSSSESEARSSVSCSWIEQQANHLCFCQQFWSPSDAFWWSALLLDLLSVAFILNVCGSFIGLRTSFELLPFLDQLRDQITLKKLKNFIDQHYFEEELWDTTAAWTMEGAKSLSVVELVVDLSPIEMEME